MSATPSIYRNPAKDMWRDLGGNFRTIFVVNSRPEDDDILDDFMSDFQAAHNNEDICYFERDDERIIQMDIMVGYAQKFETEFKAQFQPK